MQMFDDAHVKRPKKEKAVEVDIEQASSSSESDSAGKEGDREEIVQAGKAEEVTFQSTRYNMCTL